MKHLVAVLIASFGVTSALAADLPARTYVDPVYDWSGFYIGANIGYSWGRSGDTSSLSNVALFTSAGSTNLNGVVGGEQVGINWQQQNWVWGLEADIQGTGERGSRGFTCPAGVCTPPTVTPGPRGQIITGDAVPVSLDQKIAWFGTVRGRAGVLVSPKVLLYATGGLAYGEVRSNETIGGLPGVFSNSDTTVGYTVGAGIEGAIGGNWTAKLEYLYVDLGRTSGSFATTIPALGGGIIGASAPLTSSYNSRITDNVLRVGVNYKFAGPVVAKY
jgi:outer membrane immunogenic protein